MQKKKIMYLDVARILGTLFVILVHGAGSKPNWVYNYGYETDEWAILCIFTTLTKWAAPIFCMISGALFLDPDRNVSIKKLYTKSIPRILVGLIFWSGLYVAYSMYVNKVDFTKAELIKKIAGGHYHQWYLYMIIGFYILVPILRKITEDKKLTQYFTAVCVAFTFVIPFIQNHQKLDWTPAITSKMFMTLPGYLAYFLIGYYINKFDLNKLVKLLVYAGGIGSFIITVRDTLDMSRELGYYYTKLLTYNSLTVLIQTIFVFVLVKDICSLINFGKHSEKAISTLSKDTFGIYQAHPMVIVLLVKLTTFDTVGFPDSPVTPIIAVPLIVIATYVVCEVISHILNKIPIIKNYLV